MGRNPLSSQVISNGFAGKGKPRASSLVVIPYQVRSYQTGTLVNWMGQQPEYPVVIPYQVRSYQTRSEREFLRKLSDLVVIPYQVRSYQTLRQARRYAARASRVVIPYQVRSYQTRAHPGEADEGGAVVIPYQVRSYQTQILYYLEKISGRNPLSSQVISNRKEKPFSELKRLKRRNPLSSQVISNLNQSWEFPLFQSVVIPYQVRSYQTLSVNQTSSHPFGVS